MSRTFLSLEEALSLILENKEDYGDEVVNIFDSYNRVLSKEVFAKIDDPPFNRSSMDGYAYKKSSDNFSYILNKDSILYAGYNNKQITINNDECIKIMTGSVVPEYLNSVQRVEWTESFEENGRTIIKFTNKEKSDNIILKGSNKKKGEKILDRKFLLSKDIAILSLFGHFNIEVKSKINIGIISTGNEIVSNGYELKYGEIYDANGPMLLNSVNNLSCNGIFYGKVNDDENDIKEVLEKALKENDIILISGGVSMGDFDYVYRVLHYIGVKQIFHGVAVKPGKPLLFGKLNKKAIFALPGNPVSSFITFEIFVKYYILNCFNLGYNSEYIEAILLDNFNRKDVDRLEFIPVEIKYINGKICVDLIEYNNSSMISSFSMANAILKIDIGVQYIKSGDIVYVRYI